MVALLNYVEKKALHHCELLYSSPSTSLLIQTASMSHYLRVMDNFVPHAALVLPAELYENHHDHHYDDCHDYHHNHHHCLAHVEGFFPL